ncbi:MAG: MMPL family transporter [Polaromonas sp.]|nr:MMPL family transporter [Polaromonas sp.]
MKKFRHPAIGLWAVFFLLCTLLVLRSEFTADMSAFLPRDPSPRQQILIDQISEGFASKALIVGVEGAPTQVLAALSEAMARRLRDNPLFSSVSNGRSSTGDRDRELLFSNRYLLSPAIDDDRMSVAGLRAAMTGTLEEVASATGLFSKSLLARDPTGEMLTVIDRIVPANQPSQAGGVWMNPTLNRALLLLQVNADGSDLDAQESAHAAIAESFAQAQSQVGATAAPAGMRFSGPGVFAVQARDTIKQEAARLSLIGTLMVLGLLWLIYRSVTTLFLGIVPVVTGALAGVAAVGLGFPSVHGMTLGFGITLIGEAVDYAIYLFVQYTPTAKSGTEEIGPEKSAFDSSFWPTIRLGVLTSIFGFSTLLMSGFTGLAQLGLFSIVGIVVAATVTRFVLPALLPDDFAVQQPRRLGPLLANAVRVLGRLRAAAVFVTVVAITVLVLRWDTIWSVELGGLSPVSEAAQKLDADLRADIGAPDAGVLIVIKGSSSEAVLQRSEEATARLRPLVERGELGGYQAASTYLPSLLTQTARQASLPDTAALQQRTTAALEGLPLRPERLKDFFTDVARAKSGPLLGPSSFEGTSMNLAIDSLLSKSVRSPEEWTGLIALQAPTRSGTAQTLDVKAVRAALEDLSGDTRAATYLIELGREAKDIYGAYLQEAIVLSAGGFVAIVGLLFVTLRSPRRVIRVVTPLLAAAAIVAAGVVGTKGHLSLLHLIGLLLVVAIGSNYALFFDRRSRLAGNASGADGDHNMLCSLLFANLSTVLGFGLLGFSSVPVMNAIGSTVGIGTFLALLLSAVFALPATGRTPAGS